MKMSQQTVSRHNFRNQIYELIRGEIMTGFLISGNQYSMGELAQRYGVSRTPVREALNELENKGAVRILRGVGFEVVDPSPELLRDTLQLREILEKRAMASICGRLSNKEMEHATALAMEVHSVAQQNDPIQYRILDREFHVYLASLSGNSRLATIVGELRDVQVMPGLSRVALIGSLVDRSSQHFVLLDAIRRGDQQEVINSVTRHLEFSRASIPASLRKNLLDEIPNPDLLSPKVD